MILITLVFVVSYLFSFLDSNKIINKGLEISFIIITFIACIRYDYGNDYMAYYNIFININRYDYSIIELWDTEDFYEPGWNILCRVFKPFGFFVMVACLSIFQSIVYYKFIKKYVPRKYYHWAIFIYLFSSNMLLLHMSMMRQALAIAFFVIAIPYIINKKLIPAILLVMLANTFHGSALVLYPFVLLGYIPFNKNRIITGALFFSFIILFLSPKILTVSFNSMASSQELLSEYVDTYSDNEGASGFGLGFIMNTIPFIVLLWYLLMEKTNLSYKPIIFIAIIAYFIIPFSTIILIIGRIAHYFSIASIVAVPLCYNFIKDNLLRKSLVALFIFMTIYNYFVFFNNPIWIEKYGTFKTIFPII